MAAVGWLVRSFVAGWLAGWLAWLLAGWLASWLAGLKMSFLLLQEPLTEEKCALHILVRGLVRVRLVAEASHVLRVLTIKGIVNHGAIGKVPFSISTPKEKVK